MAFDITAFTAQFQNSGARANMFEVVMPFPALTGGTGQTALFSFMCRASSIPGEDLGTIVVPYFGRQLKFPGDRVFQDWTVTVINDENFAIRDVFERWSNALNGHLSNLRNPAAISKASYAVDATILQYGKTGSVIKEYDMINAWPTAVTPIDLDWAANDTIQEFQVNFALDFWAARTTS